MKALIHKIWDTGHAVQLPRTSVTHRTEGHKQYPCIYKREAFCKHEIDLAELQDAVAWDYEAHNTDELRAT
jgi:hypothetical protein